MPRPGLLRPSFVMVATVLVAALSMVVVGTSRAQFGGQTSNAANVFEAAARFPDHDIAVTDVDSVEAVGIGEVLTVRAEVVNQVDAETAFDLVLTDLTSGSVVDTVPVLLSGFETQTIDLTWDTSGVALGKHDLQAEAVVPGDINPDDNTETTSIRVEVTEHDIRVRDLDAPRRIGQGDLATLTVDVENRGNRSEIFDLVLTDTTTGTEIDRRSVSVGLDETATFLFTWDTSGAALGRHDLQAEALVADDARPGDNTRTTRVRIEAPEHDIKVRGVDAPGPVRQGDIVSVEIDVENKGNITTTFELVLRDTTDDAIVAATTVTLTAGEIAVVTIDWDTATASLGRHVLEARAVLSDDTNPGDNRRTTRVTVNP